MVFSSSKLVRQLLLLFTKLPSTVFELNLDFVVKTKSTDLRCPACKASAVPPARYQSDLPIHACLDKKINAFFVFSGKILKLESSCFQKQHP